MEQLGEALKTTSRTWSSLFGRLLCALYRLNDPVPYPFVWLVRTVIASVEVQITYNNILGHLAAVL